MRMKRVYDHEKGIRQMFDKHNKEQPVCMIEYEGEKGIVIELGDNLVTREHLRGDILVFWENGDITVLPEKEFKVIKENVWEG